MVFIQPDGGAKTSTKFPLNAKMEHFYLCYQSWLGLYNLFQTFDNPGNEGMQVDNQAIRELFEKGND